MSPGYKRVVTFLVIFAASFSVGSTFSANVRTAFVCQIQQEISINKALTLGCTDFYILFSLFLHKVAIG